MLFFEILIILFSFIVLFFAFRINKTIHTIFPVIIIFDLVMVVPILLEIFLGIPYAPYINYRLALADRQSLYIFLIFVFLAQLSFFNELVYIKKNSSFQKNKSTFDILSFFHNIKNKNLIVFICVMLFFISIIAILCSPDSSYYYHINSVHSSFSLETMQYKANVMNNLCSLLFLSVILLKLIDKDDKIIYSFIRILFIILIAFINQKRTLLLIIVGAFLVIDFMKNQSRKKLFLKYSVIIGMAAFYFYYYTIITDKVSYNSDWYYVINEYIFRSMHTRYAIYACLHPNTIHILDYAGQSFLFSIFFFVPRFVWVSKPFPYIDYYMRGLLNYNSFSSITYHMPASYYPEFISNFGLVGIVLSIYFTIWYSRFFDKQDGIIKFFAIVLISLLQIYYYDDMLKILAFIIFVLILKKNFVLTKK